jgi:hypothetical protein
VIFEVTSAREKSKNVKQVQNELKHWVTATAIFVNCLTQLL